MANPLSADRFLAALKAEGCVISEKYPDWRTHNRNHKGAWGGVNGVVIHHTAGKDSLSVCYNGISGLPGPLCHSHLSKAGTVTMIGYGRTNHAGTFAQNAHDAVINESSVHPRPDASEPVDGNAHYYGLEIENLGDGKDLYPEVQYEQAVRWATAICRAHGWSANSVIGHKEGTRRKIDPSFDMNEFRKEVAQRLANSTEDGMTTTTTEDVIKIWKTDNIIQAPVTSPTNPYWAPSSFLRDTNIRVRSIQTTLDAQNLVIAELVKIISTFSDTIDEDALLARIQEKLESLTIRLVAEA